MRELTCVRVSWEDIPESERHKPATAHPSYLLTVLLMVGVLTSAIAAILYVTFFHATVIGVLLTAVHVTRTEVSNCGVRGEN